MRKYLLLPFISLFVACGDSEKSTGGEGDRSAASASRKKACEMISLEEVAEIMGWDAASLTREPVDFGGEKDAACLINGENTMIMALSYDKQHLDQIFANYLKNGSNNLTYEEVAAAGASQAILGTSAGPRGTHNYNLRKHYGDGRELYIDLSSGNPDKPEILEKLERIAAKIER